MDKREEGRIVLEGILQRLEDGDNISPLDRTILAGIVRTGLEAVADADAVTADAAKQPPWFTKEGREFESKLPRSNIPQGLVRLRCIPINGFTRVENKDGGVAPAWIMERSPGVFTIPFAINKTVRALAKKSRWKMCLLVVLDTNVPGMPSISCTVQQFDIVPD